MVERSPAFEEVKSTFVGNMTELRQYRQYYAAKYNKETTLTDDDIIDVVAWADDDMDPPRWAEAMRRYENMK